MKGTGCVACGGVATIKVEQRQGDVTLVVLLCHGCNAAIQRGEDPPMRGSVTIHA